MMKKFLTPILGFVLMAQTTTAQVDLNDPLAMGRVLTSVSADTQEGIS